MEETRNPIAEADPDVLTEDVVEEEPDVDPTGRIVELGPKLYHWGTGRRKAARARVRLRPGSGDFVVNGKPMKEYFPRQLDQNAAMGPLLSVGVAKKVDIFVNAEGGGNTGQAGAVRLGISRALLKLYPDSLQRLREAGHLTRDPRMVERKKYGLAGARRSFQWVKR
jgi:small subunit ribosomal protein S9